MYIDAIDVETGEYVQVAGKTWRLFRVVEVNVELRTLVRFTTESYMECGEM